VTDTFTATGSLILSPLATLWNSFIKILPGLIAALILIIIGYFIALGLGCLLRNILEKAGLDRHMEKTRYTKTVGHIRISSILGEVLKWYVFLIFLQSAVSLLNLGTLSGVLNEFVKWIPNAIVAGLVVIFGIATAHFVSMRIEEHTEMNGVRIFSRVVKFAIVFMVAIIALNQIGVNASILENTFLILVGALAVGIAIALGIGLGKGLQGESKGIITEIKELLKH
jgi:small-conductance mechanosensitive channel